jgi:hypothetical protein
MFQAIDATNQGRFSGPARADHDHDFTTLDLQVYVFQHVKRTVRFVELVHLDNRGHVHSFI